MVFDISRTFDDNGTPNNFRDDTLRGTPLDCEVRPSSNTGPSAIFATGAMVTDCAKQAPSADVIAGTDDELSIPTWLEDGAPSVRGVRHLGSAHHQGRQAGNTGEDVRENLCRERTNNCFPASEDIDFDHELEFTHSRKFVLATDERGGGVLPPGATCARGIDNPVGNGGIHAYAVDELQTERPASPEEAFKAYAQTPEGEKAIFRTPIETLVEPTTCTSHVFQQIPGQNRIFMAWYSQGTQVIDYKENKDGTFEFARVGYFIPEDANQWSSAVFKHERNDDGSFTYYGVAGDFRVESGRNAIDVYKATLPPVGEVFKRGGKGGGGPTELPTEPTGGPGGGGGGGVGNNETGGGPTLPATGGGMGLIGLGAALLGASAWVGRSRRRSTEVS